MTSSFDKLQLSKKLIKGLLRQNISTPTAIQEKAIPFALENKDLIGQSVTGSGKTLAYLLPIFEKIDPTKKELQAIILAPTHELAVQINTQIRTLATNSEVPITSATIVGQVNIQRQIDKLKTKPHIIVGSTGRILELIQKKKLRPHTVKTIVIDEGDKMLDDNNITGVTSVIKTTLKDRQLMIFSASIHEKTINIAKELMKQPEIISIKQQSKVNQNIEHLYFTAKHRDKIIMLRKLIASTKPKKAIVFLNKNELIQETTSRLNYHSINAYGIYGNAQKMERKKAIDDFKNGKIQVLIASDLAARGLDITGVTHIFNMDLPEDYNEYLHRVGRTGRVNNTGTAISIITDKEVADIKRMERKFKIRIQRKFLSYGKIVDQINEKPTKK